MNPSVNSATSWAIRSSRTRRRFSRLPLPPDRIWPARSSASSRGSPKTGRPEPDVDARQRDLVEDRLAALAAERRRQRQVAERRDVRVRPGWRRSSARPRPGRGPSSTSPTTDRTALFGRVVGPEEGADVLERGRVEVVHRADRRVVVRMLRREEVALELLLERAVRPVVVRPALLVLDDLALVVEVLLAERVEQRAPSGRPRATARARAGAPAASRSSSSDRARSSRSSSRRRPGRARCARPWRRGASPGT